MFRSSLSYVIEVFYVGLMIIVVVVVFLSEVFVLKMLSIVRSYFLLMVYYINLVFLLNFVIVFWNLNDLFLFGKIVDFILNVVFSVVYMLI